MHRKADDFVALCLLSAAHGDELYLGHPQKNENRLTLQAACVDNFCDVIENFLIFACKSLQLSFDRDLSLMRWRFMYHQLNGFFVEDNVNFI